MADNRKKNSNSPYLFYLAVLLAFFAAAALLLPVYRNYQKKRQELSTLRQTLAEKRNECADLNRQVSALQNSPEAVEKVARENFHYYREGETIYKYPQLREAEDGRNSVKHQ